VRRAPFPSIDAHGNISRSFQTRRNAARAGDSNRFYPVAVGFPFFEGGDGIGLDFDRSGAVRTSDPGQGLTGLCEFENQKKVWEWSGTAGW
jgi:hypothetical protein